jgi:hypothetical protein
MGQLRIIKRSMKYGTFYKLPKKIIKSFERNKINLSSIKLYLLLQEHVHENHTCIIDPEYFGLMNKEYKFDLIGGIELLRVFGLISYERNQKGEILIYFDGYPEGFDFEYEAN